MLKAPGVLPGSPELLIQTKLLPDGDFYNFAGKGETDYVTYANSERSKPPSGQYCLDTGAVGKRERSA